MFLRSGVDRETDIPFALDASSPLLDDWALLPFATSTVIPTEACLFGAATNERCSTSSGTEYVNSTK